MKLDPRFKDTEFTVEADSFAKHELWSKYSLEWLNMYKLDFTEEALRKQVKFRVDWKDDSMGTIMEIGQIKGRPICVSFFWTTIDGHLIMFYDCTSQLADHKMVEDWLEKYCNPKHEGCSSNCDANNFHNCLQYIRNANEGSLSSQKN